MATVGGMRNWLCWLLLGLAGCGSGETGTGAESAPVCEAGRTEECACPGGAQGAQSCADDGSGWGACKCPMAQESGGNGAGGGNSRPLGYRPEEVCTKNGMGCATNEPGTSLQGLWWLFVQCEVPVNAVLIGCSEPVSGPMGAEACCFIPF